MRVRLLHGALSVFEGLLLMSYSRVTIITEEQNLNQQYELCLNELLFISCFPDGNFTDPILVVKIDKTMQTHIMELTSR